MTLFFSLSQSSTCINISRMRKRYIRFPFTFNTCSNNSNNSNKKQLKRNKRKKKQDHKNVGQPFYLDVIGVSIESKRWRIFNLEIESRWRKKIAASFFYFLSQIEITAIRSILFGKKSIHITQTVGSSNRISFLVCVCVCVFHCCRRTKNKDEHPNRSSDRHNRLIQILKM